MIDIEKSKQNKLKIKSPKKEYELSHYEMCRWFSLLEAVDIIDKKCEQLGKDSDEINWVKPIAIQKYIDERTESMLFELQGDLNAEQQCTT